MQNMKWYVAIKENEQDYCYWHGKISVIAYLWEKASYIEMNGDD